MQLTSTYKYVLCQTCFQKNPLVDIKQKFVLHRTSGGILTRANTSSEQRQEEGALERYILLCKLQ